MKKLILSILIAVPAWVCAQDAGVSVISSTNIPTRALQATAK